MACASSSLTHRTRTPVQLATTSTNDILSLDVAVGKNFNVEIKHETTSSHTLLFSNPKSGRRGTVILTNTTTSSVAVTLDLAALTTVAYDLNPLTIPEGKHALVRYYLNSEGTPLATVMHAEIFHEPTGCGCG